MNAELHKEVRLDQSDDDDGLSLFELLLLLRAKWRVLVYGPALAALAALGITFLIPNTYTSRTVFLPPQQQQTAAASALASLGALSGLAGAAAGVRTPGDQYVALLQSQSVADRIVDAFKLMDVYKAKFRFEARKDLADNSRIALGRKDGLVTIEVDDHDPQRAADIANHYVDELRRLTNDLALTEAQQRRLFLEGQLKQTRDRLTEAQKALQGSGIGQGVLQADARAAAESFARLRAEVTAAETRTQSLRKSLAESTPEVQQAGAVLQSLRARLAGLESGSPVSGSQDYVSKFREFKYQEVLFELYARQYEIARTDESREGALIQVIDSAKPAEWKSKPKRALIALTVAAGALCCMTVALMMGHALSRSARRPAR